MQRYGFACTKNTDCYPKDKQDDKIISNGELLIPTTLVQNVEGIRCACVSPCFSVANDLETCEQTSIKCVRYDPEAMKCTDD